MTNCPNCGAPITKSKCEYCDTVFSDLQAQDLEIEILREKNKNLQKQLFRINFSASKYMEQDTQTVQQVLDTMIDAQRANLQTLVHESQLRNMNRNAVLYADNIPVIW